MRRKVDFIVQSILLGTGVVLGMASFFEREAFLLFLLTQFIIGVWQYGGALIALLFKSVNYRKKYLSISSLYLLSLLIFKEIINPIPITYLIYMIVPAWSLAIYYYSLTWQTIFTNNQRQSSFLPHINF